MKLYAIHLFLILLFVLVLGCSFSNGIPFLEGFNSATVTGPGGNSATITTSTDNNKVAAANTSTSQEALDDSASTTKNQAAVITGPRGNKAVVASTNAIKRSEIPPGDEDLYVLKSTIVPPVCPACPTSAVCEREKPCPACPPCARCPEPAFECKKVPNYASNNDRYLPKPVLSDFSTFGS
jgi:uncharacterized protein (UPF0333 family)